jgi:hypothetical protein
MTEYDTDQQQDQQPELESEGIKQLRARAEKAAELERKVAEFERRDAFRDAGIDLSDKRNQYFVKGYDGELSAEAIKAKAIEDGFLTDGEQQQRDSELQAHQRADQATAGEPPVATDYAAEIANAKDQTEIMQIVAKYNPELIPMQ